MLTYPWIKMNAAFTALMWAVILIVAACAPAFAQEEGPVNEGTWVIPREAVIACPITQPPGEVDPNVCQYVADEWGPYPTQERCNARIGQLAATTAQLSVLIFGFPHWVGETSQRCVDTAEADMEEASLPGRGSIRCLDHEQMADFLNMLEPDTYSTGDGLITISGTVWSEHPGGFCHS